MELKHSTVLRAFKLFDILFEKKLLSKDVNMIGSFIRKYKHYATSCIRLLAHLIELRTLGNDLIKQYDKIVEKNAQSKDGPTLPQILEQTLSVLENNFQALLSSGDQTLQLLIMWVRLKMQRESGWSNMSSLEESSQHQSRSELASGSNLYLEQNKENNFVSLLGVAGQQKPKTFGDEIIMLGQIKGLERLNNFKKLAAIPKEALKLQLHHFEEIMGKNDLLHLPSGAQLSYLQLPIDLCFRNMVLFLTCSRFFMQNQAVGTFLAVSASLELKVANFLQRLMTPNRLLRPTYVKRIDKTDLDQDSIIDTDPPNKTLDLSAYGVTARFQQIKMDESVFSQNDTQDGRLLKLSRPSEASRDNQGSPGYQLATTAINLTEPFNLTSTNKFSKPRKSLGKVQPDISIERPRTAAGRDDISLTLKPTLKRVHAFMPAMRGVDEEYEIQEIRDGKELILVDLLRELTKFSKVKIGETLKREIERQTKKK